MGETKNVPANAKLVLITLIMVAGVANLNLAVANVALPDIGNAFDAGQTGLNLVAVGYSLGLATSVLYLGALGDRHGRKMMLILGTALAIPASLLAALAPSIDILFFARVFGGVAAGMEDAMAAVCRFSSQHDLAGGDTAIELGANRHQAIDGRRGARSG